MLKKVFLSALLTTVAFSANADQVGGADRDKILSAHNVARKEVGSDPVVWSQSLADAADKWATYLKSKDCALEHAKWEDRKAGENLATGVPGYISETDGVKMWVAEKEHFNPKTLQCQSGKTCGHYTQVVWHSTKEIGCATATCANKKRSVLVCRYNPTGNWVGKSPFKQ